MRARAIPPEPWSPDTEQWQPCTWQTHTGTIGPRWSVQPTGPTDWTGYCGVPTADLSGLCPAHQAEQDRGVWR